MILILFFSSHSFSISPMIKKSTIYKTSNINVTFIVLLLPLFQCELNNIGQHANNRWNQQKYFSFLRSELLSTRGRVRKNVEIFCKKFHSLALCTRRKIKIKKHTNTRKEEEIQTLNAINIKDI
jgi:hypothetical protein